MDSEVEQTRRRRSANYPLEFKRRLAQQACDDKVSVSQLALEHGLNTNMVFRWRRQLRAGQLESAVQLLPVTLAPAQQPAPAPHVDLTGVIEVWLGKTRVCIHGAPDPATLSLVLQGLRA